MIKLKPQETLHRAAQNKLGGDTPVQSVVGHGTFLAMEIKLKINLHFQ